MERSPSEPKRFELSREPFARERVKGIQNAVEEMREERPEILSLALFGSLVKGTSTEASDLDMYVYIDVDEIQKRYPNSQEDLLIDRRYDFNIKRNEEYQDATFRWKELRKDVANEYQDYVRQKLEAKLPTLTRAQLKDIHPNPISNELLDEMLDDIYASYMKYPNGAESTHIYFGGNITEGEEARAEVTESRLEPSQALYAMFFLDAGGGLRKYRKYLLEKLVAKGAVGEKIWADIISSTESWEQKVTFYQDTPTPKRYPRTLEAALAVYSR